MCSPMSYFSPDFLTFFEELAGDNSKDWFDENRARYHRVIKDPWYVFVKDLIKAVQKDDPYLDLEVKNAVFRINRDIRFAKDKTPYKLHVAAAICRGGRKAMHYPGIYVHLGQDGVHLGSGCYQPDKENLRAIRKALVAYPKRVKKILENETFVKTFGEMK